MQNRSIENIYTYTLGHYTLVKFSDGLLAVIGDTQRRAYEIRWEQELANVNPDTSLVDSKTAHGETYKDLDARGQLITDISRTLDGKFQIRVDGKIIDVPPEELKALLHA
jgi:hypothetical protein